MQSISFQSMAVGREQSGLDRAERIFAFHRVVAADTEGALDRAFTPRLTGLFGTNVPFRGFTL